MRLGRVLWRLATARSAPWAMALGGKAGWKPRWAPWASSTSTGTPLAWAAAQIPAVSLTTPS